MKLSTLTAFQTLTTNFDIIHSSGENTRRDGEERREERERRMRKRRKKKDRKRSYKV